MAPDGERWQVIVCLSDKLPEGVSPLSALSGSALLKFLRWRKYKEGGSRGAGKLDDVRICSRKLDLEV